MSDWQTAARTKREAISSLIPDRWRLPASVIPSVRSGPKTCFAVARKYVTDREAEITESDALKILQHTLSGEWKAREVAEAFCHRAAIAHQLISCLHEIFFEAGLDDAQAADDHFARTGAPLGPLHGLPISLKDQFHVKGVETSMGYVGWLGTFQGERGTGKEKTYESVLVKELRSLGATLYCKTSVPYTLMCGETINNIIEYTPNPFDLRLAVGGSSGGEGGLIALRGSPLGFGSDIGGSVRIPAAFNGLWGLKPSVGRLPYYGVANSMDGQVGVMSAIGPIAHSLGDVRLAMKAVLMTEPWLHDPGVLEMPWRDHVRAEILSQQKLAFGLLSDDGETHPLPPLQRALTLVRNAIRAAGHEAFDWQPPSHLEIVGNVVKHWAADGGQDVHSAFALSREPIAKPVTKFVGERAGTPEDATALMRYNVETRDLRKAYMEYWNSTEALTSTGRPIDGFIAPVTPFPAAPRGGFTSYTYTTAINGLDYSACVFPVTTADRELDAVDGEHECLNDSDRQTWDAYDPELYHGHPVCLQIVGRRLQEEKVLALAEVIEKALVGGDGPSRTKKA